MALHAFRYHSFTWNLHVYWWDMRRRKKKKRKSFYYYYAMGTLKKTCPNSTESMTAKMSIHFIQKNSRTRWTHVLVIHRANLSLRLSDCIDCVYRILLNKWGSDLLLLFIIILQWLWVRVKESVSKFDQQPETDCQADWWIEIDRDRDGQARSVGPALPWKCSKAIVLDNRIIISTQHLSHANDDLWLHCYARFTNL